MTHISLSILFSTLIFAAVKELPPNTAQEVTRFFFLFLRFSHQLLLLAYSFSQPGTPGRPLRVIFLYVFFSSNNRHMA